MTTELTYSNKDLFMRLKEGLSKEGQNLKRDRRQLCQEQKQGIPDRKQYVQRPRSVEKYSIPRDPEGTYAYSRRLGIAQQQNTCLDCGEPWGQQQTREVKAVYDGGCMVYTGGQARNVEFLQASHTGAVEILTAIRESFSEAEGQLNSRWRYQHRAQEVQHLTCAHQDLNPKQPL